MSVVTRYIATHAMTGAGALRRIGLTGRVVIAAGHVGRFPHEVGLRLELGNLVGSLAQRRTPFVTERGAVHHVGGKLVEAARPIRGVGGVGWTLRSEEHT